MNINELSNISSLKGKAKIIRTFNGVEQSIELTREELQSLINIYERSCHCEDVEQMLEEEEIPIESLTVQDFKHIVDLYEDALEEDDSWNGCCHYAIERVLIAKSKGISVDANIVIAKPINGIAINGNEYVLDEDGEIMVFNNEEEAVQFLSVHGIDSEEIENMGIIFQNIEQEQEDR